MRVLGIDPGFYATGYGLIEIDIDKSSDTVFLPALFDHIKVLEAGTIEPKPKDLIQNKLDKVYRNLDSLALQYHPNVMVLEKLYAHYKHPTTACIMGHVRGAICLLCAHRHIELSEQSVKRIRKTIVGNGNATKLQTQRMVAHILKIDESKLTVDASDALALALGYVQQMRYRL